MNVEVYEREISMLIDTGASISLIEGALFDQLVKEMKKKKEDIEVVPWTKRNIKTAGGQMLGVRGKAKVGS
jgi:predicted aspartyl protease